MAAGGGGLGWGMLRRRPGCGGPQAGRDRAAAGGWMVAQKSPRDNVFSCSDSSSSSEVQPNACHVHIILIFVPQKLLRSYMGTSHPTRASAVLTADAPQSSYPSASLPCPLAFPGSI